MGWYLVLRHNRQPRNEWKVTLDEHLAWMRHQHEIGTIVLSGPTPDRTVGIYLVRARSQAEAEQIAAGDPFTAAGHCSAEVIEWQIHQIMGVGPFSSTALEAGASRTATDAP